MVKKEKKYMSSIYYDKSRGLETSAFVQLQEWIDERACCRLKMQVPYMKRQLDYNSCLT